MRLIVFCLSLMYLGLCLSINSALAQDETGKYQSDLKLGDIKYFHSSPPPPGITYGRHSALIRGVLNIKDGCLRIGKTIPTLDHELMFNEDEQGLYLKHIYSKKKYRMGDTVTGGGGLYTAKLGQSREECVPESENGYAYFISFYMEVPSLIGRPSDCPYGRYDRGDGLCILYPKFNSCPADTEPLEDGTCVQKASKVDTK